MVLTPTYIIPGVYIRLLPDLWHSHAVPSHPATSAVWHRGQTPAWNVRHAGDPTTPVTDDHAGNATTPVTDDHAGDTTTPVTDDHDGHKQSSLWPRPQHVLNRTLGAVVLTIGSVPRRTVFELRQFFWLFIFNDRWKWRNSGTILRGTDPTVSATAPWKPLD